MMVALKGNHRGSMMEVNLKFVQYFAEKALSIRL